MKAVVRQVWAISSGQSYLYEKHFSRRSESFHGNTWTGKAELFHHQLTDASEGQWKQLQEQKDDRELMLGASCDRICQTEHQSAQSFIYRPACLLSDSSWTQANWTFNPEEMKGCCDVLRSPPYIGTRLRACRNHISFQPSAMLRLAPKSQTSLFFRADFMVLRCEGVHSSWCLVLADAELGFAPSRETNRREQPPVHSQGGGATARWGAPPTQLEAISDPLRLQFLTFLWPPPPEVSTWVMSAQEKQGGSFPWPLPEWVRRHVCVGGRLKQKGSRKTAKASRRSVTASDRRTFIIMSPQS